ncbi:hypothetical protein B0T20DRAFT_477041 [Sordaria brevicollis]|uniref:Uncharacterized protein n=1 Tax=Sordaria brevicollis TaxID=83679 RepID=A0AAE0PJG0_SORBR|nr:hypothetical protein B0T20DRAFT_477041 [Sordaria brevicollis]
MSTTRNRDRQTKYRSRDTTPESSLGNSSDRSGSSSVLQQYQQHELQQQQQTIQGTTTSGSRSGAPAVRLNMDLDVDIQLKAKMKGDITLSILTLASAIISKMPGTRSHRSRGKPSFLRRSSTKGSTKNETPEIIQQLARAALVYSLKRLTRQDSIEKGSSASRQQPGSKTAHGENQPNERERGVTTKARDSSRASHRSDRDQDRARDRDDSRDGNDLHDVMGQLAVGILGFGIRQFLHQRKKKEEKEKNKIKPSLYSTTASQGPRPSGDYPYTSYADYLAATSNNNNNNNTGAGTRSRSLPTGGPGAEAISLATTLDSLKKELRATAEALADLVNKPPSHKKCEVHEALAKRADGIRASIDNLEMAVNNVSNLHPEIGEDRGTHGEIGNVDEKGKERGGREEKGKGKEGATGKERMDDDGWGEREGRRRERERERERARRNRDERRWSGDRERKPRRSVEFEDELDDRYGYPRGSGRGEYRRRRR